MEVGVVGVGVYPPRWHLRRYQQIGKYSDFLPFLLALALVRWVVPVEPPPLQIPSRVRVQQPIRTVINNNNIINNIINNSSSRS